MSWILAAFNAPEEVLESARGLVRQTPSSLFETRSTTSFCAAGGIAETCNFGAAQDGSAGWITVGAGLHLAPPSSSFLSRQDWSQILSAPSPELPANGHYCAIRWDQESLEAFTDVLGLRTLYYAQSGQGLIASTRLDWVAQLSQSRSIDFAAFGSHWLTFNQLNFASQIKNVSRLGSNGYLKHHQGEYTSSKSLWYPSSKGNTSSLTESLAAFCNPQTPSPLQLSLGLSGGLDSRALLSLANASSSTSAKNDHFNVHTFGSASKKDVQVATEIASSLNLPHRILDAPLPSSEKCLTLLQQYVARAQALIPASAVLGFRHFGALQSSQLAIIDGGFGEVARRQFFNRLLRTQKPALVDNNFEAVLGAISIPRAEIFSEEVKAIMREGAIHAFETAWHQTTTNEARSVEDRLDLLSIWARLPNFFGFEQARLDEDVLNFMPFAQPSVLDGLFKIPIAKRKEGRLFKNLIRSNLPILSRFPLVKGLYTYPFGLPSTGAVVWTKIAATLGSNRGEETQHAFLAKMKEFALDSLESREVTSYGPYDIKSIRSAVTAYYNGEVRLAAYVDWWLTFECWRQVIQH